MHPFVHPSSIEKLLVVVFFVCFADHATFACCYACLVNQEKEAMLAVWLLRPKSLDTAGCELDVDAWDADAYFVVSCCFLLAAMWVYLTLTKNILLESI